MRAGLGLRDPNILRSFQVQEGNENRSFFVRIFSPHVKFKNCSDSSIYSENCVVCICGDAAVKLTVRKEGPNTGKDSRWPRQRFDIPLYFVVISPLFTKKALNSGGKTGNSPHRVIVDSRHLCMRTHLLANQNRGQIVNWCPPPLPPQAGSSSSVPRGRGAVTSSCGQMQSRGGTAGRRGMPAHHCVAQAPSTPIHQQVSEKKTSYALARRHSQLKPSYKIKTCIGGWPNGTAKSSQLASNPASFLTTTAQSPNNNETAWRELARVRRGRHTVESLARVGRKFEPGQLQASPIQLEPSGWPNDTQLHPSWKRGSSWEYRLARALHQRSFHTRVGGNCGQGASNAAENASLAKKRFTPVDHFNWIEVLHNQFQTTQQGFPIMPYIAHTVHNVQCQNILSKKVAARCYVTAFWLTGHQIQAKWSPVPQLVNFLGAWSRH